MKSAVQQFLINIFGITSLLAIYVFMALPMGQVMAAIMSAAISGILFSILGMTIACNNRSTFILLALLSLTAVVIACIALYVTAKVQNLSYLSLASFALAFFTLYLSVKRMPRSVLTQ